MSVVNILFYGISGTLIAGLVTSLTVMRFDSSAFTIAVVVAFLTLPAIACVAAGLRDYRVALMIVVYSVIGFAGGDMTRPIVAIAPAHREVYHAKRQLAGDIGAWREIAGSCTLAIGRILFIRRKTPTAKGDNPNTEPDT